jgi:hypothetical protein
VGQSPSGLWYTYVHAKQLQIDPMYMRVEKKYSVFLRQCKVYQPAQSQRKKGAKKKILIYENNLVPRSTVSAGNTSLGRALACGEASPISVRPANNNNNYKSNQIYFLNCKISPCAHSLIQKNLNNKQNMGTMTFLKNF